MSENKDKPAFGSSIQMGLTKREYFAAMAMQGYIASVGKYQMKPQDVADYAIQIADAMLQKLEQTKSPTS